MGRVYKSAQGKTIDLDKMLLVNEKTIAVGNMKVNARGDQLGAGGEIVTGRNQVKDQQYAQGHQQRSHVAQQAQKAAGARSGNNVTPTVPAIDPGGVPFDDPEQQEIVDAQPASPQMRGSLADSIAKTVTVNQELLDPNPNKPKGPQRI